MGLLDVLGFETGMVSSTLVDTEFDAVSVGASATLTLESVKVRCAGRYSMRAATGASSVVSYGERDWGSDEATIYFEFYVYFDAVPSAVTSFASIYDSTPAVICDLRVNASGNWALYNQGDATIYTGTGQVILANQWYRIELKLFSDAATGTIDLKVNGVLEPGINGLTGKNTKPGGFPRRYRLGLTVAQANAGNRYFDDVLISNSGWIGRGFVKRMVPTSTNTAAWTVVDAGSASWQTQDDQPWASANTDMIKSAVANQEERIAHAPVAQTSTGMTILGVLPFIRHKRTTAGSAAAVTVCVMSAGVKGITASLDAGNATWTTKRGAIQITDPNTGVAWTLAALNALLLSLQHDAGSNEGNINASLVYVAFSTTGVGQVATSLSQGTRTANPNRGGYIIQPVSPDAYRRRSRQRHGVLVE